MRSSPPNDGFPIERDRVATYLLVAPILFLALILGWFFGSGLVLALAYGFLLGPWLPRQQAAALRYWVEGSTLRIDQGVFFLKRQAIPLVRVTDFTLVQGPLQRWCGIWGLQVQTAGMGGQARPEATLLGLSDPHGVRDELLRVRDEAAREQF